MLLLLFGNNASFKAGVDSQATALFGAAPGVYDATLAAGEAAGAITPLMGGSIAAIFLAMGYIVFFNMWPNWGATLYGEVRGATDFKRNFYGMGAALLATTVLGAILFLLIEKTMTWKWFMAANGAWWNYAWGYTTEVPPLPVWPYPAMLAGFMVPNRLFQAVLIIAMSAWWFGWSGTVFLSSTRVIFAAAFDRLLPEKVAEVEPRTRTPIYALLLMVIPSVIIGALFAFNIWNFKSLTLCSTLVIAVTFLGSTIAAILLPFIKKDLYEASPIAKFKIFGIPMISIAGVIFAAFLIFLLYQWLIDPNELYGIGIKNTSSMIYMGAMYLLALAIYIGFQRLPEAPGNQCEQDLRRDPGRVETPVPNAAESLEDEMLSPDRRGAEGGHLPAPRRRPGGQDRTATARRTARSPAPIPTSTLSPTRPDRCAWSVSPAARVHAEQDVQHVERRPSPTVLRRGARSPDRRVHRRLLNVPQAAAGGPAARRAAHGPARRAVPDKGADRPA